MISCLAAFVMAFVAAVAATFAVRPMAVRVGVVDRPDQFRKIHRRDMPLLGGVAVYLAFAAAVAVMFYLCSTASTVVFRKHGTELLALMVGATVSLGLGIVDDVWGLRARWKLVLQAIAATVAFGGGFVISAVSNPFGNPLQLGFLSFPVTLFWFLGCMNAVNLLDGLDGLAAGVCLFVSLTLLLVSLLFGNILCMLLMASLSGAILGFLIFNFHPAKIFLGDSGSMMLGFLIGALSIMGTRKAEAAVALFIPFIALGLPVLDTTLAILRRWSRRLPISAPDREHIHHVLISLGLSHKRAVLVLYGACVVLGGVAVLITTARNDVAILMLGSLGVIAFVCVRVFGGVRITDLWSRMADDWGRRQRSAEAKISVEKAVRRMHVSAGPGELWEAFSSPLDDLGLDYATLRLFGAAGSAPSVLTWPGPGKGRTVGPGSGLDLWSARLKVYNNGHVFGELEVGKSVGEEPLLADTPELVDRLRREMAAQIERLTAAPPGAGAPPSVG